MEKYIIQIHKQAQYNKTIIQTPVEEQISALQSI